MPFDLQGPHLIPLYDMANHQDGCPNTLQVVSCKDVLNAAAVEGSKQFTAGAGGDEATANGRSPYCVVWKAGQDIPAGQEAEWQTYAAVSVPCGKLLSQC